MQTEKIKNCYAFNPLPPKHQMKFFRERIELWLVPHA